MSRVGKMSIAIPVGVTINEDERFIVVDGPKGSLRQQKAPGIKVNVKGSEATVTKFDSRLSNSAQHGLARSLLANMIAGVSRGYEKKLEINGVGYRVQQQGTDLKFNLGFSHDIVYKVPAGVNIAVDQNIITVSGISKQQVGQVAAEIRSLKKPEPYKGKGIKYADERIIRKSGKSGKE